MPTFYGLHGMLKPMNQSNGEMLEHLNEQLLFIDSSCAAYDAGAVHESKRLATHVRVLLHDTGASTSLLTHLGMKDTVSYIEAVPEQVLELAKDPSMAMSFPGLAIIVMHPDQVKYVPTFEASGLGNLTSPFDPWWNEPRMFDALRNTVSRRQIVLWLANKDGGAHIDKLPPTYEALSRNGSMGMMFEQGGQMSTPSPIPHAMRNIAEEVRVSIRRALTN